MIFYGYQKYHKKSLKSIQGLKGESEVHKYTY